jgi:hypothetical protein
MLDCDPRDEFLDAEIIELKTAFPFIHDDLHYQRLRVGPEPHNSIAGILALVKLDDFLGLPVSPRLHQIPAHVVAAIALGSRVLQDELIRRMQCLRPRDGASLISHPEGDLDELRLWIQRRGLHEGDNVTD